jgi:hypothetical protein
MLEQQVRNLCFSEERCQVQWVASFPFLDVRIRAALA